ncbi:hypothetical protein D358_00003 [Enterococcus faecalis RP2S-4]|uniref:Uncharacterized protein n=1 Tax=Enterococcus faecalis RP2S-4 TaxID=1244145 RepID=A0ABC9TPA7_ENTFL|nr:hypothetical protein D358_00003 [Enterococcus faecalis RP2S-4]
MRVGGWLVPKDNRQIVAASLEHIHFVGEYFFNIILSNVTFIHENRHSNTINYSIIGGHTSK